MQSLTTNDFGVIHEGSIRISLLYKITNKKGKEPVTVYINIYKLAIKRSGCLPHPKITMIIGSKENSNHT